MKDEKAQPGRTVLSLHGGVSDVQVRNSSFTGFDSVLDAHEVDGVAPSGIIFDNVNAQDRLPEGMTPESASFDRVLPATDRDPWYKQVFLQILAGVVILAITITAAYFGLKG